MQASLNDRPQLQFVRCFSWARAPYWMNFQLAIVNVFWRQNTGGVPVFKGSWEVA